VVRKLEVDADEHVPFLTTSCPFERIRNKVAAGVERASPRASSERRSSTRPGVLLVELRLLEGPNDVREVLECRRSSR
jgi:hypothetical protein